MVPERTGTAFRLFLTTAFSYGTRSRNAVFDTYMVISQRSTIYITTLYEKIASKLCNRLLCRWAHESFVDRRVLRDGVRTFVCAVRYSAYFNLCVGKLWKQQTFLFVFISLYTTVRRASFLKSVGGVVKSLLNVWYNYLWIRKLISRRDSQELYNTLKRRQKFVQSILHCSEVWKD